MQNKSISFIVLLRPIAALLVVWDHLANLWLQGQKLPPWSVGVWVYQYINTPLGIIQNFGWLGVCLFFFISGFIITFVAEREDRKKFIIRRVLRIYPPYIVSLLVFLVVYYFVYHVTITQLQVGNVLRAMTLVNYLHSPMVILNGVAWTLIIEMLFYVTVFLFLPLLNKRPQYFVLLALALTEVIILQCHAHGANFFLFAASYCFLPYLILGQVIYFYWSKKWSLMRLLLNGVLIYAVLLTALFKIFPQFYPADSSFFISAVYALTIFIFAMKFSESIKIRQPFKLLSESSYSLYLFHTIIGPCILYIFFEKMKMNFSLVLMFALACTFLCTYLSWRFVELPTQRFARKLTSDSSRERQERLLKDIQEIPVNSKE